LGYFFSGLAAELDFHRRVAIALVRLTNVRTEDDLRLIGAVLPIQTAVAGMALGLGERLGRVRSAREQRDVDLVEIELSSVGRRWQLDFTANGRATDQVERLIELLSEVVARLSHVEVALGDTR